MGPEPGESWLFRQGDLILGPVPSKQLVDKIYSGELDGKSEVQAMGSNGFVPLASVAAFKVHLAKAQAKSRVDAQAAQQHAAQKKKTVTIVSVALGVLLVAAIALAALGSYLAVHAPTASAETEITIEAPTINAARRGADDELMEYNGPAHKRPAVAARNPSPSNGSASPKARMGAADSEGMQMGEVDQAAINAVVAQHKRSLVQCIQLAAQQGARGRLPIAFAVNELGKVSKVWVDQADFRTGPVPDCLLKELQKWPFRANAAGGAEVQLSFNIGKSG